MKLESPQPSSSCAPTLRSTRVSRALKQFCFPWGEINATWNDRFGKNGRQYGTAPHQQRSQLRGLRQVGTSGERVSEGQGDRRGFACRDGKETREATSNLVDGTGRCG